MASEILLVRLMTGEDVIGKITKNEKTIVQLTLFFQVF